MCVHRSQVMIRGEHESSKGNETQKEKQSEKLAVAALLVCTCAGLALARPQAASAAAPAKASSVTQAIKQLEHHWEDSAKAGDADKMGAILADDWVRIAPGGKMETKKEALADLKSGTSKVTSDDPGPMDVKVMGKVAVVQGTPPKKACRMEKIPAGNTRGRMSWKTSTASGLVVRSEATMVK